MKKTPYILATALLFAALALPPAQADEAAPAPATTSSTPAVTTPVKDPEAIVRDAQRALKAEKFDEAEQLLGEAMKAMPSEASLPYNLGVARFRQGNFAGAAEAFTHAAELANDPNLAARSAFNQGTATYAQALKNMKEGGDAASMVQPLNKSVDLVGNSLEQLKHAIEANPEDRDARANAELAHRLLKQLKEMQQQQQKQNQQQDQQQNDQQKNQQKQSSPSNQSDQKNDQQSQQQQQDQNQSKNGQSQQDQQQQQQQSQEQQQSEEQQKQDEQQAKGAEQQPKDGQQAKQDEQKSESEGDTSEAEPKDGQGKPHDGTLTRAQAERLLQMVRDKQRERRAQLAKQNAGKHKPVDKDW